MELSDTISKDVADKVRKEIFDTRGVSNYEDLKIRKAGNKIFVRATVHVPDYISLEEAHDLTSKMEENIKKRFGKCGGLNPHRTARNRNANRKTCGKASARSNRSERHTQNKRSIQ
jgi:divalent metal cation (Fe/Co/Zn/Cd) transporter